MTEFEFNYDLMSDDLKGKYEAIIQIDKRNPFFKIIREAIIDFDNAVNPFINKEINIEEMRNMSRGFFIDAKQEFDNGKVCNSSLQIGDCKRDFYHSFDTYSSITDNRFVFSLFYKLNNESFKVKHTFYGYPNPFDRKENCVLEKIDIEHTGIKNGIEITINCGNYEVYKRSQFDEQLPINIFQLNKVYNELLKAIEYAKKITDNYTDNNDKNKCRKLKK